MKNDGQTGTPDVWSLYLATADAKATADAAAAHGGQVIVPAMEVGELGSMAVVTDAGGAAIGVWQPGLHKGFGVVDEAGHARLVRAAHPGLRRLRPLLPGRLRVGHRAS